MRTHPNFLGDLLGAIDRSCSSQELKKILEKAIRYGQHHPKGAAYVRFMLFMKAVKDAHESGAAVQIPALTSRWQTVSPALGLRLEGGRGATDGLWDDARGVFRFADLMPDRYRLLTDTGWLLWQQDLRAEHLLTAAAFPSQPIRVAADSAGLQARPTGDWILLDKTLRVRVYPGIEAGCVEVVLLKMEVGHGGR